MLLEEISGPEDVRGLGNADLERLCAEIRERLVTAVARTGGHLGPNLGVVELTVAMHRVFELTAGSHRLRHRPPGLRAQDAHRAG